MFKKQHIETTTHDRCKQLLNIEHIYHTNIASLKQQHNSTHIPTFENDTHKHFSEK